MASKIPIALQWCRLNLKSFFECWNILLVIKLIAILQSEEAQRLRKRRRAESMRLCDIERRQKQRIEEVRQTQKKVCVHVFSNYDIGL